MISPCARGDRPEMVVAVDLVEKMVRTDEGFEARLGMPEGARQALLGGRWDPVGDLFEGMDQARAVASSLAYVRWASVS